MMAAPAVPYAWWRRQFLAGLGIMDYSLLVGIHDMTRGNRDELRNRGLSVFDVRAPTGAPQLTPGTARSTPV